MAGDSSERVLRVYVASMSEHGPMWQGIRPALADLGAVIVSTWIDENGPGETADMADLWRRSVDEASTCDLLIAMHATGETWKGASFVEIGAALAALKPVYLVGRPPGSWVNHHLVTFAADVTDAIEDYRWRYLPASTSTMPPQGGDA